ncbi:hypothetical protein OAZ80_01170 [bacterium]|nr:hypothetical protein [bacterium]
MSRRLAAVAQAVLSSLVVSTIPMGAVAQVEAPFQNREEREIYGDTNGSGSILDAANPTAVGRQQLGPAPNQLERRSDQS